MNIPVIRTYVGINIISTILALTLNFLAVSLPINNKTTAELSDAYPNFFVPAGFTFSIWGIIYLMIIGFTVYQAWQYFKGNDRSLHMVQQIGTWYFISGLANAAWIMAWHYELIFLSVIIMTILLISLIRIYLAVLSESGKDPRDTVWLILPFSIYLGWISVAFIANITTYLISIGWQGLGIAPYIWSVLMMVVALVLAIIMSFRCGDLAFAAVIIWAIFGIYSKQSAFEIPDAQTVAQTARFIYTLLSIFILIMLIGKKSYFHKSTNL